jgi:hypothetical protein
LICYGPALGTFWIRSRLIVGRLRQHDPRLSSLAHRPTLIVLADGESNLTLFSAGGGISSRRSTLNLAPSIYRMHVGERAGLTRKNCRTE